MTSRGRSYFVGKRYQEKSETLEKELVQVLSLLSEMVNLKNIKDSVGKNEYYKKNQPLVWEKAKELLDNSCIPKEKFIHNN